MYGEYEHTVDAKGRMFLPSKFRAELGDKVVLSRGMDGCVCIYPEAEWKKYIEKFSQHPDIDVRHVARIMTSSAMETDVDSQGRVLIQQWMRDYAQLGKTVTVIGVDKRAEIWNREIFAEYKSKMTDERIEAELRRLGI